MNHYPRHLGDYAKDTGHLTTLEHGCYTLLTDWYYANEKPIPAAKAHRITKASTRDEKAATDTVLEEFFVREGDLWTHKRIEEELAKYREQAESADEKRENEKERQRRHRERRKALFDQLREHDIVPPYDVSTTELETLLSRVTGRDKNCDKDVSVTRDTTAIANNQEPITNNQNTTTTSPSGDRCPVSEIIEVYRKHAPSLVQPRIVPDAVKASISARWRQSPKHQTVEFWERFFAYCEGNDFLAGRADGRPGKPPFRASLEWVIGASNFAKIVNGNYERPEVTA